MKNLFIALVLLAVVFVPAPLRASGHHPLSLEAVGFCRLMDDLPQGCGTEANKRCVPVINDSYDAIAPYISVCGELGMIPNETADLRMKGIIDPDTGKFMPIVPPKQTYAIYLPRLTNVTKGGQAYMATLDDGNLELEEVGRANDGSVVEGWVYNEIVTPGGKCANRDLANVLDVGGIRYNNKSCPL